MWRIVVVPGVLIATLLAGCGKDAEPQRSKASPPPPATETQATEAQPTAEPGSAPADPALTITSSAFPDSGEIPVQYTCRGRNVPPPLAWTGVPADAVTLALVLDDPDAVGGLYVHWVVSDLPPSTTGSPDGGAPPGGRVSANSGGDQRYLGPCPPAGTGTHHYRFTLYALPRRMDLTGSTPASQAVDALARTATARRTLTGTYSG